MLARNVVLTVFVCSVLLCIPSIANATLIISATHAADPLSPGSSLDDVRMAVDLSVIGGTATMTFTNVSVPPEFSAIFKTIVVDLKDDDTDQAVLWSPIVRNDLSDGIYSVGPFNVLPGYEPYITDGASMIELNAVDPAPSNGITPSGNKLVVEFATSLADGSDIFDYLAFFNGGADTEAYSLGFHAISTDTIVNDGSLTGVPEPASLALLVFGVPILIRRKLASR